MSEDEGQEAARRLQQQRRAVERARHAGGSIAGGAPPGTARAQPVEGSDVWADQTSWPLETKQFAFLGSAILSLGRAQHGERWSAAAHERTAVAKSIVQACADGALRSWYRLKTGGTPEPLAADRWFTDNWAAMIDTCALTIEHRLEERSAWLFVDGDQLEQMILRAGRAPTWAPVTAKAEAEAEAVLRAQCEAYVAGTAEMPVKARFLDGLRSQIGERAVDRVWAKVAQTHAFLSGQKGKRRSRRPK